MSVLIWKKSRVETKQGYGGGWEARAERREREQMTNYCYPGFCVRNLNSFCIFHTMYI